MKKRVIVAMSGGVDSSACIGVLQKMGYDVLGITLGLSDNTDCDAKKVAKSFDIPHYTYDYTSEFKNKVIESFVCDYEKGKTPNPCLNCNRYIKFKAVLDKMEEHGADYIATGHYAKIFYDEDKKRYLLKKAADLKKDQSYVLYNLTQYELSRLIFPLGDMNKEEVRKIASEKRLVNADKADSQDICFIPDGDYGNFIRKYRNMEAISGDYIDKNGNFLGKHNGYINYTTGQRKGLGMSFGKPMFVLGKNVCENQVILGDEKDLYKDVLYANDINLISVVKIEGEMRVCAKTRYSQKEVPAVVTQIDDDRIKVVFDTPIRAITSGQAVVLYDGDIVVGGGIIE